MIALSLSRAVAWLVARGVQLSVPLERSPNLTPGQVVAIYALPKLRPDPAGSRAYAELSGLAGRCAGTSAEKLRLEAPYEHVVGVAEVAGDWDPRSCLIWLRNARPMPPVLVSSDLGPRCWGTWSLPFEVADLVCRFAESPHHRRSA